MSKISIKFQGGFIFFPPARLSETYLKYHGKKRSGG